MIAENQIRERLSRYLRGEISLDRFEDWFVEGSWNMHLHSEEAAQKLAAAVELRLAEYSSGHLDEASLRNELLPLVNKSTSVVSFGGGLPAGGSGSNNNIIARHFIQVAARSQRVLRPEEVESSDKEPAGALG